MVKNWAVEEDELAELIALKYITGVRRGQFTPSDILRAISHTVKNGGDLYDKVATVVRRMMQDKEGNDFAICMNPSKDGLVFSSLAVDSMYLVMINGTLIAENVTQNPVSRVEFNDKEAFLMAVPKLESWLRSEPEREFFSNFIDLVLATGILKFGKSKSLYQEFLDWAQSRNIKIQGLEADIILYDEFINSKK